MENTKNKKECQYKVVKFENGKFGVMDISDTCPVAAGMSEQEAIDWAARLNLRHVWGI